MNLLDAAIAFALSIAGFATVVTVIVEIIHRIFRLRPKGLRAMLVQHFDDLIKPALEKRLGEMAKEAKEIPKPIEELQVDLIDKVIGNPLHRKQLDELRSESSCSALFRLRKWVQNAIAYLPRLVANSMLEYTEVSAEDYLLRLPDTDAFEYLKQLGKGELKEFAESIDKKYGEYEKAISDFFKRRAQLLALIFGIGLAIGANIHGLRLFERYIDNPELTARVIAQTDEIGSAIKATQDRIANQSGTNDENLQIIQRELQRSKELMGNLARTGLPMGWNFYPNCPTSKPQEGVALYDPDCGPVLALAKEGEIKVDPAAKKTDIRSDSTLVRIYTTLKLDFLGFLQWLFVVIVTGMLIGLGGPFWFDVARRLAGIRQQISPDRDDRETTEQAPKTGARREELIKNLAAKAEPVNSRRARRRLMT
jgi:uncharacterized membrane protein YciS (DUF1049 family)